MKRCLKYWLLISLIMTAQMHGISWILYSLDYNENAIFYIKFYATYGMTALGIILMLYFQLRAIIDGDGFWPRVKWEDTSPRARKMLFVAGLVIFVTVFLTLEMLFFGAIVPAPEHIYPHPTELLEGLEIISD